MSPFEWLVLALLVLIAVLVGVAIAVGIRAASNARDAKDEAEHERLLMRGTGVTPEQMQAALEQVLKDTGVLELVRVVYGNPNGQRALPAREEGYYHETGQHYAAGPHEQYFPGTEPMHQPGHPLDGYREVGRSNGNSVHFDEEQDRTTNGRVPALASIGYQVAQPYGTNERNDARRIIRGARDPLGTNLMTDTLATGLPPISAPPVSIEHPEVGVEELEVKFRRDAENTQGWSIAWNGGSGERPQLKREF